MKLNKRDFFIGVIIGIVGAALGSYLYAIYFGNFEDTTIEALKRHGLLGKIITLGSILDLLIFAVLLKFNKDSMAKGIVMAVILVTIFTVFV